MAQWDVVVVGGGNAGYSAAIAAKQAGAGRVLLIEKSTETSYPGGNSYFTAGAFRTVFDGLDDLLPILHNVDAETAKLIDMDPYTPDNFMNDLMRVTGGRADPDLANVLVGKSRETIDWLSKVGIQFRLSFNRQAYKVDGRFKFWGGMVLSVVDGGKGMIQQYHASALRHGVAVQYGTSMTRLVTDVHTNKVLGLEALLQSTGTCQTITSHAVILTCGGFEASPSMRAQYLGKHWDLAHVRGTPFNTGDGLMIAQRDVNAKTAGGYSSCHATCWDASTDPNKGDTVLTNQFTKSGYPLGIMVNRDGHRFVDEGMDFRNYTYAFFGKEIMHQPGSVAFQIFDAKALPWLREEEYADHVVHKVVANSIEALAEQLAAQKKGSWKATLSSKQALVDTICEYNDAVAAHRRENPDVKWDPAVKDGLSTQSSQKQLKLPKSNWALSIDQAPFVAVKITTGITFTFGGLGVDPVTAAVLNTHSQPISNLYAAGEIVGGAFYDNYPGGSGLMLGAILARKAGTSAAAVAAANNKHTTKL
ncbi:fumarate reductase flavoprotein subunit precursor [Zychaea mexicana]|uniref:fumarate reductase flavoprotein subunit precursor n=1 Tax=Zychaea mexicana TaxID=64656 RepID=UPI0022FE322A|nr:fumarate reductase flavoprotein subunit precursor [Zychaea mexicana]KAI9484447.1 fumarate reductase flavoprotein subunit precursor [Zychaea mexicana]